MATGMLLDCDSVADWRDPHRQLHISELSRFGDGCATARRPFSLTKAPRKMESTFHRRPVDSSSIIRCNTE